MARSRRSCVPLLAGRKEVAAHTATHLDPAEATIRLTVCRRRGDLKHAARNVRTRGDNVGFFAEVCAGSAAGKTGDVVGAVGVGIAESAVVASTECLDILCSANCDDVFARAWRANG